MYIKTKECETLAEFWTVPSFLPEAKLILPKEAKPINLWIYIPLGVLVVFMFYWQIKKMYAEMEELADQKKEMEAKANKLAEEIVTKKQKE